MAIKDALSASGVIEAVWKVDVLKVDVLKVDVLKVDVLGVDAGCNSESDLEGSDASSSKNAAKKLKQ